MPGFRRVFRQFPGIDVLTNIESVNIIDQPPPGQVVGAGTGAVLLVGEFEDGLLERTQEVFGTQDFNTKYGGLGFSIAGNTAAGPVAQRSGGDELWNGNGFIWVRNKVFTRLLICRVDNRAGDVTFSRLSCLLGGSGPFAVSNGDQIQFLRDGAASVTAQFDGTAATITGTGGTFPTGFTGGETAEIRVDSDAARVVVFTAADQSLANVVARINAVLALDVASDSGGELQLSSVREGRAARIEIVGGTALATLGLPLVAVSQVDTFTVVNAQAGNYVLQVTTLIAGVNTTFSTAPVDGTGLSTTQLRDDLLTELGLLNIPGITFAAGVGDTITATGDANVTFQSQIGTEPVPGDVTVANTTPAQVTVALGTGNVPDLASFSAGDAAAVINAVAGLSSDVNGEGLLRVCNDGTPETGTLQGVASAALTALGFNAVDVASAASASEVTVPAGTRIQDTTTGEVYVTLITTTNSGGSFDVGVRPFNDTDSALPAAIGDLTQILDLLPDGFTVTNAAAVTRLSAPQLEAAYQRALDATLDDNSVAREANFIASARSSENIIRAVLQNSLTATASGLQARKGIVRPLLGISRADAADQVADTRDERLQFAFPGWQTLIPEIQAVGSAGGVGFTDDGIIDVGSDSFLASIRSILPPEENAGQRLQDTNVGGLNVLALESAYDPESGGQPLNIADYQAFRRQGITAPRISRVSGAIYQSDVTTVDRAIDSVQAPANRRAFGDFVIDSLGDIGVKFVKKLNTPNRRNAIQNEVVGFLRLLQAPNQPETSRIEAFQVFEDTTEEQSNAGVLLYVVRVQMFDVIEALTFRTEIGATVTIEQTA